jgi:hypothetical protein
MLTLFLLAQATAATPIETPAEPVKTVAVERDQYACFGFLDVIPIVDTPEAWAQARAASLALARARMANAKTDQDKGIAQAELDRAEKCAAPMQFETPKADNGVSKLTA